MKRILLGLTTILTSSVVSSTIVNGTTVSTSEKLGENIFNMEITDHQYVENGQSINDTVEYRLYLDSTNDVLSPEDNKIDWNLRRQDKNKWYDWELQLGNFKFADFNVNNRDDLISAIGHKFSLSYYYGFNMWDSKKGWRHAGGKNNSLTKAESTVELKNVATTDELKYEKADSGTEASRIQLRQEWGTSELKIYLRMSVWYYWAWGSIYSHASLTKFSLTDINNDSSSQVKFGVKTTPVTGYKSMTPGTSILSLDSLFDKAREIYDTKNKENWKSVLPLFVTYSAAGPIICVNGWGYSTINIFSYEPLVRDIALTMLTGSQLNGKLKLFTTITLGSVKTDLSYVDITGLSYYLASTTISTQPEPISVTYVGVATLSYMYLI